VISQNLIILAAGKPHNGELPVLLTKVTEKTVFDWSINALSEYDPNPQVVVGYAANELKRLPVSVKFCTNEEWETSGSAYSLLCADLSGESIIVSYADILYRPNVIEQLKQSNSDVTVVYDSHWKKRFVGRTEKDLSFAEKVVVSDGCLLGAGEGLHQEWANGEFIGLVCIQGPALEYLRRLQTQQNTQVKKTTLSGLIEWLRLQGVSISAVDVMGDWAELNEQKDIAHFILGTKAQTLDRLRRMVNKSIVLNQSSFTVFDWKNNSQDILKNLQNTFKNTSLVVRSSAKSEDAFSHSNAGAYTSVLNVDSKNGLQNAITEVINSYSDCQPDDEVLVQPMLQDVKLSGVAFTRTLDEGAPFYVVNFDESGDTESITSGYSKLHKSLYFRKDAKHDDISDKNLIPVVEAIKEIEQVLNYDALDIEFALDNKGHVYLLQVRPIAAVDYSLDNLTADRVIEAQKIASEYWVSLQSASPQIVGEKALFGSMPDWNPAEIIGTNPGKLAVSLYEYLILNEIWSQQRAEYGYRNVQPQPLLRMFAGKPYVDIRASFNSFIPKTISDSLSEKLVNFYLAWLEEHPYLHDKVEFDVVPTCVGPMFSKWEKRLSKKAGLMDEEISQLKKGLLTITQQAIFRASQDLDALSRLEMSFDQITSNKILPDAQKIQLLLESAKDHGALPFAHLARSGFISVTLLKEGVEAGWLSVDARDGFMETVHTVSHELSEDAWLTAQGQMSWDSFSRKYGHLRPGTYDINSPAYWEKPEQFLAPLVENAQQLNAVTDKSIKWQNERKLFFTNLRGIGLDASDAEFEKFLIESIEGREKAKFIFTRSLSKAMSIIERKGARYELTPDEIANLSINELLASFNAGLSAEDISSRLKIASKQNKQDRGLSKACHLPSLLCKVTDFSAFICTEEKPNYVGTERIIAPIVHLSSGQESFEVKDCIVVIPQADPGYDWLFGQNIAGLITMYGGANSHMAIRSAEFGLPAAIGVGEQLYKAYNSAKVIELDPAGETIRIIQ